MSALIDTEIYRQRLETEREEQERNVAKDKRKATDETGGSGGGESLGKQLVNGFVSERNNEAMDEQGCGDGHVGAGQAHMSFTAIPDRNKTRRFGRDFESICTDSSNEKVFIASSNAVACPAEGFIHKYNNIYDVNTKTSVGIDMGLSSCKEIIYTTAKKLIAGFDSGALLICDENLSHYLWYAAHDGYYTALCTDRCSGKTLITSSIDCTLREWDLSSPIVKRVFHYPHASALTGIDFQLNTDFNLISCGADKAILMWDLRLHKPTSKYANLGVTPTCLKCSPTEQNVFYIGTDEGVLVSFDVRKPAVDLGSIRLGASSVYRLKFLSDEYLLGYCLESGDFGVAKEKPMENRYYNASTEQIVRDFLFYKGNIYTVGRNSQQVVMHALP